MYPALGGGGVLPSSFTERLFSNHADEEFVWFKQGFFNLLNTWALESTLSGLKIVEFAPLT
jgi:hypothetical protein